MSASSPCFPNVLEAYSTKYGTEKKNLGVNVTKKTKGLYLHKTLDNAGTVIALEDLCQLLGRQLEGKGEAEQVAAHHREAGGAHVARVAPQLSASAASQLAPVDVRGSVQNGV